MNEDHVWYDDEGNKQIEKYCVDFVCGNCGETKYSIIVPIGKTVRKHLKGKKCKYCGCLMLQGDVE